MRDPVRTIIVFAVVIASILLLAMSPYRNRNNDIFYAEADLNKYLAHSLFLPSQDDVLFFADDSVCGGCHGYDPLGYGMVDSKGNDVNVYDDWRTTMMANSTRDPFWRAKVSQELLVNPGHSLALQTKCTSCHAPQGHYRAILFGATHYTIEDMLQDSLAMDGVSCGACHSTSKLNLGTRFSGELTFDTSRVIYGPYPDPFSAPMTDFVGFEPVYSQHIHDAGICASCHTLITQSVDLDGNFTGEDFVEQATYHEWLNSAYNVEGATPATCQECHMPQLYDSVVISSQFLFLNGRAPFGMHDLVGGNTMMLKLMKENKDTLGIAAQDSHFDETISKTFRLLQEQTLEMELTFVDFDADSAYFSLKLTNKTGHKFPSGYPSRRAFVEFIATTELGDTLLQSGVLGADFEIQGQGASMEPHRNVIGTSSQVQIYELVPGDVEGNFTTILERAYETLKDNRLTPIGFSTSHATYDTVRIFGRVLDDPDFNHAEGSDLVHYHVPLNGFEGYVHVSTRVYYQSLPPKWMAPLFALSTPEIDFFKSMYDEADLSPVLIGERTIDSVFIESLSGVSATITESSLWLYPNPALHGILHIANQDDLKIIRIDIFDMVGRLLSSHNGHATTLPVPSESQMLIVVFVTDRGQVVRKIVTQ